MSYRVAHVRFTKSGRTYPVNCHRRDLNPGDIVVVEMAAEQTLKVAQFDSLEHLNWRCSNTIICRRSELQRNDRGENVVVRHSPKGDVLETLSDLGGALINAGWRSFAPTSRAFQRIFAKAFDTIGAAIIFRRNGIDYQLFDSPELPGIVGQQMSYAPSNGRLVRNWYYHSEQDLFDRTLAFAQALERPPLNVEPFFHGLGSKPPKPPREVDELGEIRDAITGGGGGLAYLCDDVWI